MKQKYKVCVHYQTYDGYMGFDDWDDEYSDVEIVSSKLGDELTQEIVDFAKNKYKHFRDIKSITCLGPIKEQDDEVEIVKPAIKRNFVCANCGTEFNVLQYKCEHRQTGLNEYHYTHSCPECHDICYSYKEAK